MTGPLPSAVYRRRRVLVAAAVLALVVVLAGVWRGGSGAPDPTSAQPASGSRSTSATSPAPSNVPLTYLAWTPGGFPAEFRARSDGLAGVDASVVVAGDTRWMTESRAADRTVVDRPTSPFAIPIDAFAVDPAAYAPFLPPDLQASVTDSLRKGEAVLGQRSADLRGIGPGGVMHFGGEQVTVGAVAPDEAVGWSELLVSRKVGARLGIEDDRYLLARMSGTPSDTAFGDLVGTLLPAGTLLRVATSAETPYVRVASGVDPPVVMKAAFGEFAAHPDPANPAALTMDPDWVAQHLQTRTVPQLGPITCNRALFPMLIASLRDVAAAGLGSLIHTNSGCYNPRTVARNPTAPPSNHAYGAAVDINAPENPYGAAPTMDPRIVRIFERHGFRWGGDFLIPDGMHFEYAAP